MNQAERVFDYTCKLGEGPIYIKESNNLLWVDILDKKILLCNLTTQKIQYFDFGEFVGCLSPVHGSEDIIVAGHSNVYLYNMASNTKEILCKDVHNSDHIRFNDGKCDPYGRYDLINSIELKLME